MSDHPGCEICRYSGVKNRAVLVGNYINIGCLHNGLSGICKNIPGQVENILYQPSGRFLLAQDGQGHLL
jgi:hypothetical protein